ncbi:MAG: tyrosine--tRNA ligase [Candidatus Saccharibacteria bacterium]|nr:tyrosine--tRNA ligase [Candidatus Saccharibacteria bacterium]
MKKKLSEELSWRGFVNQTTYTDLRKIDTTTITFYWGVDPSASSMTVGNLAIAMMVRHFIDYGHKPVLLVGGATGLIGDPDGKTRERDLITKEEVERNKAGIVAQYKQIFDGLDIEVVDNYDWFKDIGYLQFLRDIGKHVPMRQMLGRDFVQSRLSEGGAGISYAEFSYALIQGYDFLHLHKKKGVDLQVCGSDQWGNSIAGVDLVRRLTGDAVHVWSAPLVVNKSTGTKFGKSEDGAIWLDNSLTSVYKFYQFWLNVDDISVEDFLKIYTLLSKDEILATMEQFQNDRGSRAAQKVLAFEVTKLVHGQKRAQTVKSASDALFGQGRFHDLDEQAIKVLKQELPVVKASEDIYDVLVSANLAQSKSEARTFVQSGAISLNGNKLTSDSVSFEPGNNILKRGKNACAIVVA